jgi:CxxC motif-containing protein (DUF1111 family)
MAACGRAPVRDVSADPGQPLPGLEDAEAGRFLLGKAVFERLVVQEEGLGPLYNADRCSGCHNIPATGGSGTLTVTKATRFVGESCDLLEGEGGDNIQQRATPLLEAHGIHGETIPDDATGHATIEAPPLYGLGLIEAIDENAIIRRADPDDADGDGISGRAGRDAEGRLARFSRKADVATIEGFIDTALRFEIGLTTPGHPQEERVNGRPLPDGVDPKRDPEIDAAGIGRLVDYVRFLAPPAPEAASAAASDSIRRGSRLFERVRCDACHTPSMRTTSGPTRSLSGAEARLYSDLLLHDMGPDLADVCGHAASPSEWRTSTLWGLRYRSRLMHDGRATDVRSAILLHDGEAAATRNAFSRLSATEQADLLRFLASL